MMTARSSITASQQATDEAFLRKRYADHRGDAAASRMRKSVLDAALQTTKNGLDLINAAYKAADDQLQALRKATLISDQSFYEAEISLANDLAQRQIAAYGQEKKTLQDAYWKAPMEERIRITQEIGDVDTKIAKVRQDNASKVAVLLTQQTDAQRQYLKSITDTRDALFAQAGISTPKALHDFDERYRGAMLQAATTGDVGTAAFLDQDRQLTKLTAQYNDLIVQATDAKTKISLDQQERLTGLGLAASVIAKALGTDPAPDSIMTALASNPDAIVKLKQAEMDHERDLAQIVAQREQAQLTWSQSIYAAEAADRDSARRLAGQQSRDWMRPFLAVVLMALTAYIVWAVMGGHAYSVIKDTTAALTVGTLIGYVLSESKQVLGFYFGITKEASVQTQAITSFAVAPGTVTVDRPAPADAQAGAGDLYRGS